MKIRSILLTFWLVLAGVLGAWGQGDTPLFPIAEVKPGLKGVGRTVFQGDRVEEFQVEILGLLKNALAPKRDLILARLSGGPLEKTGVIAGMSGSPVYIDGKLVGAVAIAFPFSKEPVAGITPIQQMLDVVPEEKGHAQSPAGGPLGFRLAKGPSGLGEGERLIPQAEFGPDNLLRYLPAPAAGLAMPSLQLPLRFGGFSTEVLEPYLPLFRQMGFEPMMGGSLSAGETSTSAKPDLGPGSMISLELVRGDLNLNADCTVTYRQGNNLYACGHRALSLGPSEIPFASAVVLTTVSSLSSSFKLDAPGQLAGTIRQDRFDGIYGVVGEKNTPMIPVSVEVQSTLNTKDVYRFELIQESFLSPVLANLAVGSALSNTERSVGSNTLQIGGKIRLAGAEAVDLQDVLSSDMGTSALAGSVVATPLYYLMSSGFPDLRIEGIDLSVRSTNDRSTATLEQAWSTKSEVRPGDHLEVIALLRLPGGQVVTQRIPISIPDSVADRNLMLAVGGGASINALQYRLAPPGSAARDLHQLVKALNRMRRNNRLYALLMAPQRSFVMEGEEYPSPPPSLIQTFMADPAATSSVSLSGTSVVGDYETAESSLMIRGQKMLFLKVAGPGL
jgi:hypothetical protein